MSPICSEHAALLRAVAKNTNDHGARDAYTDWLQEHSNPGWLIVQSYLPQDWATFVNQGIAEWPDFTEWWRLPWLLGSVEIPPLNHPLQRVKAILTEYANGKVRL